MKPNKEPVYRSADSRHALHSLYRRHLLALDTPVYDRTVDTGFGDTHVVFYGRRDARPVLFFYGELGINPLAVRPFVEGLDLDRICLIVPDPPGQVGFSDERKLAFANNDYGRWACRLMDALGLQTATVVGYSFGGSIALQLCAEAMLRVERLLLVVPSGLCSLSARRVERLVKPARQAATKAPTDTLVAHALAPILPFNHPELVEAVRMLYTHAHIGRYEGWCIKKRISRKIKAPVYLITEKADALFAGEALHKRALALFSRLEGTRMLRLGSHCGLFAPYTPTTDDADAAETDDCREVFALMTDFLTRASR